jgi:outer membrane protein OmpA-like peptidoglycan-associated protein
MPKESTAVELVKDVGRQLIPLLVTAGSLIGFIAAAGGVIVWTRFSAAKVPPDQVVNAVPRDELVAIGSSVLLIFGFFGVLVLACAFLIDRGARATPGMARALLLLFLIESVTTVVIATGPSAMQTIVAAELVALPVFVALWATFFERYVDLIDDLSARQGEHAEPRRYGMLLLPGGSPLLIRFGVAVIAGTVALVVLFETPDLALLLWLSASMFLFALCAAFRLRSDGRAVARTNAERRRSLEGEERKRARDRNEKAMEQLTPNAYEELNRLWKAQDRERDDSRLLNDRPMRLRPNGSGAMLGVGLLLVGVALPACRLGIWWVAVSIAAAALLTVGLWRISALSAERVIWYGIAIFLSVPLFGTLTAMARNIADPQVQPMALIRNTDGPYEAIQGLYVTEADERVYFATVATEGCTNRLRDHSGRLEWVPKSEVVAMSVGPSQDVEQAAGSALEMAYALTPAVETRAGGEASLTAAEKAAAASEEKPAGPVLDKRLEGSGAAVRPFYGAGLSLSPEDASPTEDVTLRLSAPNKEEDVEGFGAIRNGHTVRVGGVRAKILKQPARSPESAEFLETAGGKVLKLKKGEPFVRAEGEYIPEAEAEADDKALGRKRFVDLADPRVLNVLGETSEEGDWYLELDQDTVGPTRHPRLALPFQVRLKGGVNDLGVRERPRPEYLSPRPLGQAWHPREIRFEVPENASTGAVSVECSQLAGQPLLRVSHAPEARIAVHMQPGTDKVTFDSSRSTDTDEEALSRHWDVSGLQRGNQERMSAHLPSRVDAYSVKMTATDESGSADTVELHLLRLPASLFESGSAEPRNEGALAEAREALRRLVRAEPPATIEIDGHADYPGSRRYNANLSLRRAVRVREALLDRPLTGAAAKLEVPVRTLAYGEDCPVDPRPGPRPRDRRVDVFVLDRGVSMAPARDCDPHHFESSNWLLLACKDSKPEEDGTDQGNSFEAEFHKMVLGLLDYLLASEVGSSRC